MKTKLRSKIIQIGNSRGVRIPRPLLEQAGLENEVEMSVEGNKLVISSAHQPRKDWEARFAAMAEHGDDQLLDEPAATAFDEDEWTW